MKVKDVKAGQLLLVAFPFSDTSTAKVRPVLVISEEKYNRGDDFVCLPLSTRMEGDYSFQLLSKEPWFAATKLRGDSAVKWTKLMTLSTTVVHRPLGTIPDPVLLEIRELVKTIFTPATT